MVGQSEQRGRSFLFWGRVQRYLKWTFAIAAIFFDCEIPSEPNPSGWITSFCQKRHVVRILPDQGAELVQPHVALAAGDIDAHRVAQPGQVLLVVARQRLLEPHHA
jgi:hypothetical protein